jgi:hypothetical protein
MTQKKTILSARGEDVAGKTGFWMREESDGVLANLPGCWLREESDGVLANLSAILVSISTWSADSKPSFLTLAYSPILRVEAKHQLRLSTDHMASYPILNYS